MKAIETHFRGCRFRSRLEARWAVFFDALGIKWQYEAEGFEAEDGSQYLPDFLLPEIGTYVEVKGTDGALVASRPRLEAFVSSLPHPSAEGERERGDLLILGEIPDAAGAGFCPHRLICHQVLTPEGRALGFFGPRRLAVKGSSASAYDLFSVAVGPGLILFAEPGQPGFSDWGTGAPSWTTLPLILISTWHSPNTASAYAKARAARFEHGEAP